MRVSSKSPHYTHMAIDLLVAAVSRRGEGRSVIGWTPSSAGHAGFVRLVAPTPSGVLLPKHHRLASGGEVRPLDLIRVAAPWADSRSAQPENRIVDDSPWRLLERPASRPYLAAFEQSPLASGLLFGTPARAVRASAVPGGPSILCVAPVNVLAACEWRGYAGAFRTRLRFDAGAVTYDLPLTDLHYHRRLLDRGEGLYTLEQIGCRAPHGLRLLLSLGEPFHGWCHKVICGIVPRRTGTLFRDDATPRTSPQGSHPGNRVLERTRAHLGGA